MRKILQEFNKQQQQHEQIVGQVLNGMAKISLNSSQKKELLRFKFKQKKNAKYKIISLFRQIILISQKFSKVIVFRGKCRKCVSIIVVFVIKAVHVIFLFLHVS